MSIVDAPERRQALDVDHSFCVTAPAGSGKTELLIQRYLALLARVSRPEQVLAITFTRKAAAEMRERVLQALAAAQQSTEVIGEHEQVTRGLAVAALAASERHNWHLSRDVARLNIKTIDSFCAGLTRQMPVLSRFGGQANAVDNALPLYQEAVIELLGIAGSSRPEAPDLDALLLHFDNNWDKLAQLLAAMLAKRDQWHEYMGSQISREASQQRLEQTVAALVTESLEDISRRLTPWRTEIHALFCYAQGNLGEPVPDAFPAVCYTELATWRALASMFLTQAGTFRKSVNVRNGFPSGDDDAKARKAQFTELVGQLAGEPGLEEALAGVAWLPLMDAHARSWQLVVHLSHVLPLLSACLLLVFERHGVVDHNQVALSALDALGEDEAPTELALRLDYSIEHILVDEFQDTAINQYRLVERLTRGWGDHNESQPEAARTIFIVGDGMQSIYGFRNANVGLFLKAREQGFNGVVPRGLALRCNFRSNAGVVDWVNGSFAAAFPPEDDVRRGRVAYTDAVAVKPPAEEPAVSLHGFWGDNAQEQQEAQWLVETLQQGLRDDTLASVAVLARSRSQLAPVMQRLREMNIPFAGQDMDSLAQSPAIVDLLTLCRALSNPADRVAWLALLRAPWCALTLDGLDLIASASEHPRHQNVWAALCDKRVLSALDAASHERVMRLTHCLQWAQAKRDRLALRVWVEQLWLHLGGPACLSQARYLQDAERFFELLQQAELDGVGLDPQWLTDQVARLYAASERPDARLQVMTLHKAKGLEFDWVLIPALARATRSDDRDLLLWDEYNGPGGSRGFLLAADDHSDDKTPGLYNFLKRQRREKSRLETTRLLYVGATRAVKKLTLSACLVGDDTAGTGSPELKPPPAASLLAPIWPVFERDMVLHAPRAAAEQGSAASRALVRLENPPAPPAVSPDPVAGGNRPEPALNWLERHIGTAIHEVLEQLSLRPALPDTVPAELASLSRSILLQKGIAGARLVAAQERVMTDVHNTLADHDGGRWILSSQHIDAQSELPLTVNYQGKVRDIVVDRTFVDPATQQRWVVDYKSSKPAAGGSLDAFLAEEASRYEAQLRCYRDSLARRSDHPVRCALYFTALGLLFPLTSLDRT